MDLRSIDPKTLNKKPSAPAHVPAQATKPRPTIRDIPEEVDEPETEQMPAPVHHAPAPAQRPRQTSREIESEEIESTPIEEEHLIPRGQRAPPEPEEEEQPQEITMSPEEANQLSARIDGLEQALQQAQIEGASLAEVNSVLSRQLGGALLRARQLEGAVREQNNVIAQYQAAFSKLQPKK